MFEIISEPVSFLVYLKPQCLYSPNFASLPQSCSPRLVVRSGDGSECSGPVLYQTEYSIYSSDGGNLLDIGTEGTGGQVTAWDQANSNTRWRNHKQPKPTNHNSHSQQQQATLDPTNICNDLFSYFQVPPQPPHIRFGSKEEWTNNFIKIISYS